VDDIAEGHLLAAERGRVGESYILAGPTFEWKPLTESWEDLTGIPAPRLWMPDSVVGLMQTLVGALEGAGFHQEFSAEGLGTIRDYTFWATAAKATRELGWQARSRDETSRAVLGYEITRLGIRTPKMPPPA
jgi:dihydroflavonol-4-reductase